jgi:signal transduction histidine kinase
MKSKEDTKEESRLTQIVNKYFKKYTIFVVAGVTLASISLFSYGAWFYREFHLEKEVSKAQHNLQLSAESIRITLRNYLKEHTEQLQIASKDPAFIETVFFKGKKEIDPVKIFYEINEEDVSAFYVLNSDGIVIARRPEKEGAIGNDYSKKPGFRYVSKNLKPYLSEIFLTGSDKYAVSITVPAIKDEKFVGALRWLIESDVIYKNFLEHENQGGREVWIADNDGEIVSHPISYHIGNDFVGVHEYVYPNVDWSSLKRIMSDIKEGKTGTDIYDYHPMGKTFGHDKILIAYAPLNVNNQQWTVAVTVNLEDISGPIDSQAKAIYGLAGLLILGSLVGGLLLYRSEKNKAVLEVEAENLRKIHRLEAQLLHAQKMEVVGRLAGGIAHDFNNLLTPIVGFAELLKEEKGISPDGNNYVDSILNESLRGSDLTGQLLAFARKGEHNPIALNINNSIIDGVKMSEHIFEKNINVRCDLEEQVKSIIADENQIRQVITNLIINAKDAMPDGGDLTLKTENVFIDQKSEDKYPDFKAGGFVKISVTDTGNGIPEELRDKIFEPFFTTKAVGKGTGLGLASVYGTINNHNGFITVDSEINKGTTFAIYLPATERKIIEKDEKEEVFRGSGTILYADDEEHVRNLVKAQLESIGYEVLLAQDGVEAMEIYADKKDGIDLVLLDLIMPRCGGKQALNKLIKQYPEIKVIMTSGYTLEGQTRENLEDGAKGFLQKPFKISLLSKMIHDAMKG